MLTIISCEKVIGADAIRHMTEDERAAVAARFWTKTEAGPNGCLIWTGGVGGVDYGYFWVAQGVSRAHRVAYELTHGPIPAGLLMRHKCHNPLCVNPEHLEPGTHADNTRDMIEAGRQPTGAGSKPRRLTVEDAVAIPGGRMLGFSLEEMAVFHNAKIQTIAAVLAGRTWRAAIEAHTDAVLAAEAAAR